MIVSWDALLIAGTLLIIAWVIFYRWRLQEKAEETQLEVNSKNEK